jgi:ribosomal protein S18 acetylase RimI-like enzyme
MSEASVRVRPATRADLPRVARLAARLVRDHYALDPKRYLLPDNVEQGYEYFLGGELGNARAVLLVAVRGGGAAEEAKEGEEILGYAYGRLEPRNWNDLLDACGKLHDVYVDDNARRLGVGATLVREMCARLEELGAPRVLLLTAVQNTAGQALFASLGFRQTMIEMTRERSGA